MESSSSVRAVAFAVAVPAASSSACDPSTRRSSRGVPAPHVNKQLLYSYMGADLSMNAFVRDAYGRKLLYSYMGADLSMNAFLMDAYGRSGRDAYAYGRRSIRGVCSRLLSVRGERGGVRCRRSSPEPAHQRRNDTRTRCVNMTCSLTVHSSH